MSEKPKRRWYQFSLKTLLVTMTMLCIGPGGFVAFEQAKSRQQKAAVDLIEARGGGVDYDDEVVRRSSAMRSVLGEDRYGTTRSVSLRSQETRECIPYLHVFPHLQDLYLGNISDADLVHLKALNTLTWLDLRETNVTDSGLESLAHLSKLEGLQLYGTGVSDRGLVQLGGLHHLTLLDLGKTQVTDADLVAVSRLMSLERLYLYRTKITDAGLGRLADLPKLTYLDLTATAVTDAGVQRLQKALPNLQIDRRRPWRNSQTEKWRKLLCEAQMKFVETEEELDRILENDSDGIAVFCARGKRIFPNQRSVEMNHALLIGKSEKGQLFALDTNDPDHKVPITLSSGTNSLIAEWSCKYARSGELTTQQCYLIRANTYFDFIRKMPNSSAPAPNPPVAPMKYSLRSLL